MQDEIESKPYLLAPRVDRQLSGPRAVSLQFHPGAKAAEQDDCKGRYRSVAGNELSAVATCNILIFQDSKLSVWHHQMCQIDSNRFTPDRKKGFVIFTLDKLFKNELWFSRFENVYVDINKTPAN
jgi:hypothetical protein